MLAVVHLPPQLGSPPPDASQENSIAVLSPGSFGVDVYKEASYFFEERSQHVIADDMLARLLTFPSVLVTGHQAFFTQEALQAIADTSLSNLRKSSGPNGRKMRLRTNPPKKNRSDAAGFRSTTTAMP